MNCNYILILLLIVLIIVLIYIILKEYKNVYENFEIIKEKNTAPLKISTKKPELIKQICQTYHTKSLIPEIVKKGTNVPKS